MDVGNRPLNVTNAHNQPNLELIVSEALTAKLQN